MLADSLESLDWLMNAQTSRSGFFEPIGSDRPWEFGAEKPVFDQQPIEAATSMSACLAAWKITGDDKWYRRARVTRDWFLGKNALGVPLCTPNGAC